MAIVSTTINPWDPSKNDPTLARLRGDEPPNAEVYKDLGDRFSTILDGLKAKLRVAICNWTRTYRKYMKTTVYYRYIL